MTVGLSSRCECRCRHDYYGLCSRHNSSNIKILEAVLAAIVVAAVVHSYCVAVAAIMTTVGAVSIVVAVFIAAIVCSCFGHGNYCGRAKAKVINVMYYSVLATALSVQQ